MRVLGIETSCDETAVAIYDEKKGLLKHLLKSQAKLHAQYGGVVPELASRDHIRHISPLINHILSASQLRISDINGIAYTAGPGLVGALLVGATLGRSLAWALDIPAVAIHHMEGHLLAPYLEKNSSKSEALRFPFLGLLVSGGHTLLVQADKVGQYKLLGETVDDAVGEAFDKIAKLLNLGYPGGPAIEQCAKTGRPGQYLFSRPMTNRPGLNFSFSGLKTQVANTIKTLSLEEPGQNPQTTADIALAFQTAVTETLVIKCKRALQQTGLKQLVIAGGVSSNLTLRQHLTTMVHRQKSEIFFPPAEFCTDNAAMIAFAGMLRLQAGQAENLAIITKPQWPLDTLTPLGS